MVHKTRQLRKQAMLAGARSILTAKAKLSTPPSNYKMDAYYRVQLSQAVQLANGTWMRPSDDVVISGGIAAEVAKYIVAAQTVAAP